MTIFRSSLVLATLAIYVLTILAVTTQGYNWPAVALGDIASLNWRSQFDVDFIIHLLLLAGWVVWREGATPRGYVFGFLSIVMGGMFSFPYLLHASLVARGDVRQMLLGVRAGAR